MGKLNMGILGGFSGTVGTVVGMTTRKGDDVIRIKTKKKRPVGTANQLNHRSKFSLVLKFLKPLNFLMNIGFELVAGNLMSPLNYGFKRAMNKAITGTYPDYTLDYKEVLVSEGYLMMVKNTSFALSEGIVNFHWDDNTLDGNAHATDKAVLFIYNENNRELSYSIGKVTRMSKTGALALPYGEVGDKMLLFMFFQLDTDPLIVSTSQFLGSVLVNQ